MQLFASFLVARPQRAVMRQFHSFVAAARAIVEEPGQTADDRLTGLESLRRGLAEGEGGAPPAAALARACAAVGISTDHAGHILQAARATIERPGLRSWSDLLLRCRYGAAPIGRFALDLHGEDRGLWAAADALCAAHQITAELGALGQRQRDGLALPLPDDWLRQSGAARGADVSLSTLQTVVERLLDGIGRLADSARPLERGIRNRGLRRDATLNLALVRALQRAISRGNPLDHRIELSFAAQIAAGLGALVRSRAG